MSNRNGCEMSVDYALVCGDHKEKARICSDGVSGPLLQCDRSLAAFVITHRKCSLLVFDEVDTMADDFFEWDMSNWSDKLRYDKQ